MRFLKSLFGEGDPVRSPLKAKLRLETLDGRLVPDATPITPPGSGTVTTPPAQSTQDYLVDLQVGDWVWVATRGTQDILLTKDADGSTWAVFSDSVNQTFAAVLIDSPTSYHPELGTTVFTPDATLPSYVWDPNTSTYFTAPAGTAFAAGVTGSVANGVNLVFLQLIPPAVFPPSEPGQPPALIPPAANPAPVAGGGVIVELPPTGQVGRVVTIDIGGGASAKVTQLPGTQGVKIKIEPLPANPPATIAPGANWDLPGTGPLPVPGGAMDPSKPPTSGTVPPSTHWLDGPWFPKK